MWLLLNPIEPRNVQEKPVVKNLFLIANYELVRLLSTRRGWVSIVAFALVWAVLLYYVIFRASRLMAQDGGSGVVSAGLDFFGMERLNSWSVPELAVYWFFGLTLLPFFCVVLTADQTASDRSRGTLRFLSLRSTRWQIFFGRYIGQLLLLALFIVTSVLTTLPVALYRDSGSMAEWLALAPAVMVNLLIVLLPYAALMAIASILAKSAFVAILYAIILWIVVWFISGYLHNNVPQLEALEHVLPGSQMLEQLKVVGWDAIQFAYLPLVQAAVLLAIGWLIMRRRHL